MFHWGYHHSTTRAPEGMACCMRVLIGTIMLVVSENLLTNYKGRQSIFQNWRRFDIKIIPGSDKYERYMSYSLSTILLKAADTVQVPFEIFTPRLHAKVEAGYSPQELSMNYLRRQMQW
jgi:hypothetical protein